MTDQHTGQPFYARRMYRLLTAAFGLLLIGVGIYALFFAGAAAVMRWVGGSALVLAGFNMVWSAYKARESWLSKLGPLP